MRDLDAAMTAAAIAATAAEDWYDAMFLGAPGSVRSAAEVTLRNTVAAWLDAGGQIDWATLPPWNEYIRPAGLVRRRQLVAAYAASKWAETPSPEHAALLGDAVYNLRLAQSTLRHTRSGHA